MNGAMRYLILLFALACGSDVGAQGVIPRYGTRIEIVYRATEGRFPVEENIASPAYPAAMRRAALEDVVTFTAVVGDDGRLGSIAVGAAKFPEFRRAVEEVLPFWRFRPRDEAFGENAPPVRLRGEIRFCIVED